MPIVLAVMLLALSSFASSASVKESWTCYRQGSEFLKMSFDGQSYSASLQGVLEKIALKGEGDRPSELFGREEPFYDTINYTVKINRGSLTQEGLERETVKTKITLQRHGYWDCYGRFSDSEALECTVEIERD